MNTAIVLGLVAVAYLLSKKKAVDISSAIDSASETVGDVVTLTLKYYDSDNKETTENISANTTVLSTDTVQTTYSITPEQIYDAAVNVIKNTIEDIEEIVATDSELASELYDIAIAKIEENMSSGGTINGTKDEIAAIVSDIVSEVKSAIDTAENVADTSQENINAYVASATRLVKDSWTNLYANGNTRKFYVKLTEPITRRLVIQMTYSGGDFNVDLIASTKYPPTCIDFNGNGASGENGFYFNITDQPMETISINEPLPAGTIIMITACERSGSGDYKIGVFGY